MWAEAVIPMFTDIAIRTENLKTRWVAILFKPPVEGTWTFNLPTVFSAILYVVNFKKKRMGFGATSAMVSPVSHNCFMAKHGETCAAPIFVLTVPFGSNFYFALFAYFARFQRKVIRVFNLLAFNTLDFHKFLLGKLIITISDYQTYVKRKVQRLSLRRVGASVPKRIATRTVDDIVCSAWEHAAVLN
jgi:hypothetical protein